MKTLHESHTQALAIGETWKLGVGGSYVRIKSLTVAVTLRFFKNNVKVGEVVGADSGERYNVVDQFDRVDIVNGGTAQTVVIVLGNGESTSPNLPGSIAVTGTVSTTPIAASTITNTAKNAAVGVVASVLPASAARKSIRFRAYPGNIDVIYLGAAAVTGDSPLQLAPGEFWEETIGAAGQWFAYSPTAGQTLLMQEVS